MHPVIQKARALLARGDADDAEHQVWVAEHAAALEIAEVDALLAKPAVKTRDYGDLIYKRNDAALMHQMPQSTEMPAELQRAWNRWADERIRDAVEETARIIGEEVGIAERELRREYDGRINELSSIVSALRLEIGALRAKRKPKPNAGT